MEKFDILFANLFFDAYQQYRSNEPLSASWKIAFELLNLDEIQKQEKLNEVDQVVAILSEIIKHLLTKIVKYVLRLIKRFEEKDLKRILRYSRNHQEHKPVKINPPFSTYPVRSGL